MKCNCDCTSKEIPSDRCSVAPNLDLTKPIALRNGMEVKISHIDGNCTFGYYKNVDLRWVPHTWTLGGSYYHELSDSYKAHDIVNVEPEVYKYINIYENYSNKEDLRVGEAYSTRLKANYNKAKDRVGCMKIKLERRFDD